MSGVWYLVSGIWNSDECIFLKLHTKIPGSSSNINEVHGFTNPHLGGFAMIIKKKSIEFRTQWPEGVDLSKISVNAVFTINLEDGS